MNMLRVTGDGGWRFKLIEADDDTHSSPQSGQWSKHSLNVSPEDITDKGFLALSFDGSWDIIPHFVSSARL
jgi:hypothetical protein